jgi:hypothetical protein
MTPQGACPLALYLALAVGQEKALRCFFVAQVFAGVSRNSTPDTILQSGIG